MQVFSVFLANLGLCCFDSDYSVANLSVLLSAMRYMRNIKPTATDLTFYFRRFLPKKLDEQEQIRQDVTSHCQSFIEGCTQVIQLCMLAARTRGLQTVISIRVQPTEDLLPTTLHLSTDSLKSNKIQKKGEIKYRTNQATKEGE